MGCGIISGRRSDKVYLINGSSHGTSRAKGEVGFWNSSNNDVHDSPALTLDTVLCEASRPDWAKPDLLVFQSPRGEQAGIPVILPSKSGSFFSQRTQSIGQWRMQGNVLQIIWGKTRRVDSALATQSHRQFHNAQHQLTVTVQQPEESPHWFTPVIVNEKYRADASDIGPNDSFECSVCFFELWRFPACVMRIHSRRACSHYLHMSCGEYVLSLFKGAGPKSRAQCPACGADFVEIKPMPDIRVDPRAWFAACDADFGGELDDTEIIAALGATLPVSRQKLERLVSDNWKMWDPDGDGTISLEEFLSGERGLCRFVLQRVRQIRSHAHQESVPSPDRTPRQWFDYWDADKSGTLAKGEVVRALVRTFCVDSLGNPLLSMAHHLREVAASLWEALGYSPFEEVGFVEFARPYGLMDQVIHNHAHTSYWGEDEEKVLLT